MWGMVVHTQVNEYIFRFWAPDIYLTGQNLISNKCGLHMVSKNFNDGIHIQRILLIGSNVLIKEVLESNNYSVDAIQHIDSIQSSKENDSVF